jgi:hypothetical protein
MVGDERQRFRELKLQEQTRVGLNVITEKEEIISAFTLVA